MPDAADDLRRLEAEVAELRERVRVLEGGRVRRPPWNFGLTAVNRIGAFTLAIGIIFFFKYAVDNEWIGAWGRVGAGLALGSFLIGAAEWTGRRREERSFAQGISGCGLAALYISLYAASAYYRLIPQGEAFFGLVCVCGVAICLSFRYRNAAIAALGFLAALLTPMLLHGNSHEVWPDIFYVTLLDVTCVAIAMWQSRALLIPLVGAAALGSGAFLIDSRHAEIFGIFAFVLAVVHGFATLRSSAGSPLRNALYLTANGCLVAGVLREIGLRAEGSVVPKNLGSVVSELDSVFLAGYGIVTLTYGIARGSAVNRSLALFLIGLVIAKLYLWDVWFLERFYRTTAFVGLGILLLGASWIYSRSKAT